MLRIELTPKVRAELACLRKDTGLGPQRLLKGRKDRPKGLNSTTIYQWMDGTLQTAREDHLLWVLDVWSEVEPLVSFTDADITWLNQELSRTGYTPSSILRRLAPVPDGLTTDILSRLKSKRLKKIAESHKSFLFEGLKSLPDKAPE